MTAPNKMAKRAAAGTLALAVCFTGGMLGAGAAQAAAGFNFNQRFGGADRFETAVKASQAAFEGGAGDVIVVQDDALADGLTASYLAGVKEAPILYVKKDEVPSATAAELDRLKAERVYIVGGSAVVSDGVKTSLGSNGRTVTRIGGVDRFDTAAKVATSDGNDVGTVFIANGDAPADALAAGPIAYKSHNPILLTRSDSVPAPTAAALAQLNEENRIVLGGNAVVSTSTYSDLGANNRLGGKNRQETAALVADYATANEGFSKANAALVGPEDRNTADALIAAPLAGQTGTPILFTARGAVGPETTKYLQDNNASLTGTGYVFGGTGAVSDSIAGDATSAAGGSTTTPPPPPPPVTPPAATDFIVTAFDVTANTVTYSVPASKGTQTVTYTSADKFTVDGADASIGGFEAALTTGDRLGVTKTGENTSTFALTNVKVESGLIDVPDPLDGTFDIVDPVTGTAINTADDAPKNYRVTAPQNFVTYTLGGKNVDLTTFEASLNDGDTIVVTGGDGQTTERTRNFGLTDETVTGSIQTDVDATTEDVQIETPAGATFAYDISTAQSITVDGKPATLQQVEDALSIGDAASYTRVNDAVSFTLTNAAPQSITGTVQSFNGTDTITYYASSDGTKTRDVVVAPTADSTFKVDGVTVTREQFIAALTPADSLTYTLRDPQKTTDKSVYMITNQPISGKIRTLANGASDDDNVDVLFGDSQDIILATVDISDPGGADVYDGNTAVAYFINGESDTAANFRDAIDDVRSESSTGSFTVVDNGSTTEFRLVSAVAAGKPIAVARPATGATTLTVTFSNPVYLKGAVDAGDFVIKRVQANGTESAVTYRGATPQTVDTASETVTLNTAPITIAAGDSVSVQLTETGAAKFVDSKGQAAKPATVVSPTS